ncbi:hypothetical protein D3C79_646600 [compost metagenome]
MLAGNPSAGEYTQQLVPVPCIDRVAQGVEVAAKCIQRAQDGFAVGEEDVVPHDRIATGDSREIAEATRSVPEDLQVFIALGQGIDQTERQQVRQVTGGCQDFVVALHRHVLDVGAQRAPQAVDQDQCGRIGFRQRRENDFVTAEQGGVRGLYPALLGTGNRMPGHEARQTLAKHAARGSHHVALGAADISDHRIAQVELSQARQDFLHGQDRHRQLDDIGTDTGGGKVVLAAIDHTQRHGLLARGRVEIDTDHFAAQAGFTQALGEGAADQAQAHDHQPLDKGCGFICYGINHECEPCSETKTVCVFAEAAWQPLRALHQSTAFGYEPSTLSATASWLICSSTALISGSRWWPTKSMKNT